MGCGKGGEMNVPEWHKEAARIYARGESVEWRTPNPINPMEGGEMGDLHLLDTGCKWHNCRIFLEAPVTDPKRPSTGSEEVYAHYRQHFAKWLQSTSGVEVLCKGGPT